MVSTPKSNTGDSKDGKRRKSMTKEEAAEFLRLYRKSKRLTKKECVERTLRANPTLEHLSYPQVYNMLRRVEKGEMPVTPQGNKRIFYPEAERRAAERIKRARSERDCRDTHGPGGTLDILKECQTEVHYEQTGKRLSSRSVRTPCNKTMETVKRRMDIHTVQPQHGVVARENARKDPLNVLSLYFVLTALLTSGNLVASALWVLFNFDVSAVQIDGNDCKWVDYVPTEESTWALPVQSSAGKPRKLAHSVKFIPLLGADGSCGPLVVLFYDKGRDKTNSDGKKNKEETTWLQVPKLNRNGDPGAPGYICVMNRSQPGPKFWEGYHTRCVLPYIKRMRRDNCVAPVTQLPPTPTKQGSHSEVSEEGGASAETGASATVAPGASASSEVSEGGEPPAAPGASATPAAGASVSAPNLPAMPTYQSWNVQELKAELKSFGLTTTGNKPELITRLNEHHHVSHGLPGQASGQVSSPSTPGGNLAETPVANGGGQDIASTCPKCSKVARMRSGAFIKCVRCNILFNPQAPPVNHNPEMKGHVIIMFDGEAKQLGIFKLEDIQKKYTDAEIYAVKLAASCSSTQQTCDVGVFFVIIKAKSKKKVSVSCNPQLATAIRNAMLGAKRPKRVGEEGPLEDVLSTSAVSRVAQFSNWVSRLPLFLGSACDAEKVRNGFKEALGVDYDHYNETGEVRLDLDSILGKTTYQFTDAEVHNIKENHDAIVGAVRTAGSLNDEIVDRFSLPRCEAEEKKRKQVQENGGHFASREDGSRPWHNTRVQAVTNTNLLRRRQEDIRKKEEFLEEKKRKAQEAKERKRSLQDKIRDLQAEIRLLKEDKKQLGKNVTYWRGTQQQAEKALKQNKIDDGKTIRQLTAKIDTQKTADEYRCCVCTQLIERKGKTVKHSIGCDRKNCPNWTCVTCTEFSNLKKMEEAASTEWYCAIHK